MAPTLGSRGDDVVSEISSRRLKVGVIPSRVATPSSWQYGTAYMEQKIRLDKTSGKETMLALVFSID